MGGRVRLAHQEEVRPLVEGAAPAVPVGTLLPPVAGQPLDQAGDALIVLVDLMGKVPAAKRLAVRVSVSHLFGKAHVQFHLFIGPAFVPEAA